MKIADVVAAIALCLASSFAEASEWRSREPAVLDHVMANLLANNRSWTGMRPDLVATISESVVDVRGNIQRVQWRISWGQPFAGKTECLVGPVDDPVRRTLCIDQVCHTADKNSLPGFEWRSWTEAAADPRWPTSLVHTYYNLLPRENWRAFAKKHRPYELLVNAEDKTFAVFFPGSRVICADLDAALDGAPVGSKIHLVNNGLAGYVAVFRDTGSGPAIHAWYELRYLPAGSNPRDVSIAYEIGGAIPCVTSRMMLFWDFRELGGLNLPHSGEYRDGTGRHRFKVLEAEAGTPPEQVEWNLGAPGSFKGDGVHIDMDTGVVTKWITGNWSPASAIKKMIDTADAMKPGNAHSLVAWGWPASAAILMLVGFGLWNRARRRVS